jgi:dTDP-glucose 4,6-dehydratase
MKLLVTGGAGFMGSNFIHYILKKYPDYEIINLDKLTYAGNLKNLTDVENNPRYKFVKGDIADPNIVNELVPKVDAVINYAAETHVDRSILDPREFAQTDVIGTLTILNAIRENVNNIKLIQISTDEVFGSIETGKFIEDSPFEPNSPYAASKAGGDLMCRAFWATYKTPVIVTHSCNFYGANHYPEKLIPLAITNLLEGKKVPVYGDGRQVREWIYTEDHCSAVDTILHKGIEGEIYNIGTERELENLDTIKTILNVLGMDESYIEFVKDRPAHDRRYSLDTSKLRNELRWSPQVEFEDGIRRTVEWFKNNESWWKEIKSGEYQKYYEKQYGAKD